MNSKQDSLVVNIQETAAMLKVSTKHLRRLLKRREFLEPFRLGTCIRWSRKAVEQWIENQCRQLEASDG